MPASCRDRYLQTLNHIESAYNKVRGQTGKGHPLAFPDVHKLTEGLFLSANTYWEVFLFDLLRLDLASDSKGALRSEISKFRTKKAPYRLAERILNHPDHPDRYVEWSDYNVIVKRADEFLGTSHRFVANLQQGADLAKLKRIRNAVAHKSDKAWNSFISLVSGPPFSLTPSQRRGITPGRFLSGHQWNGTSVMQNSINVLRAAAYQLVP